MIGKTIKVWQDRTYVVDAVYANPPDNSSQQFDFVFDIEDHYFNNPNQKHWRMFNEQVFLFL